MSRNRRTRARGGRSTSAVRLLLAVAILVSVVAAVTALSTTAFTSVSVSRSSTAAVTDDTTGLLGLDVAGRVSAGSSDRLVTVTNRLDSTLDLTVSLDESSASLSNARGTLAPGESLTTTVTVDCNSPLDSLSFTVDASAGTRFQATATRSTSVDASACGGPALSFASIQLSDLSTPGRGGKAEYTLQYTINDTQGTFQNVTASFENLDRTAETDQFTATGASDTIQFESGGQRIGDTYTITIRLFGTNGEVQSARIQLTDPADGNGIVYQTP